LGCEGQVSDGITEGLINNLAQLPKLRVTARSTAFRYKRREVDPEQVGKDLHVKAVLTGRVTQRDGNLNEQKWVTLA
jgi:TolB-like protein